jgi:hypothetical protein
MGSRGSGAVVHAYVPYLVVRKVKQGDLVFLLQHLHAELNA